MKWAKFDASSADAYVQFNNEDVYHAEWWAQVDICLPSPTISALAGIGGVTYSAAVFALMEIGDINNFFYASNRDLGGSSFRWSALAEEYVGPVVAPCQTYTLKWHYYDSASGYIAYVDGVEVETVTGAHDSADEGIAIGGQAANHVPGEIYYITNVKMGTSDGASDIFNDNFSGGDFSLWDAVYGDCSIVNSVSGCTAGAGLESITFRAFQS